MCCKRTLTLIVVLCLSSAVSAEPSSRARHWASRALRACQRSIVRVLWGEYHDEDDRYSGPQQALTTLSGAKVPSLPNGAASPSGLPPEEVHWAIPSSPSQAVPIVEKVLRTVLTYVSEPRRYKRVAIEAGSAADLMLKEITKGFRRAVEDACVDRSSRGHEIVYINVFFGAEFHTFLRMRRDATTGELILELTRLDAPMAAIAHDISRNVIGHAPRFVPRVFRFFGKSQERPQHAIEEFAAGLGRFAEVVRASNASSVAGEMISSMERQLRRVVMVDFLRYLEMQMGNPPGADNPRRVVTDALSRANSRDTFALNNFDDARQLLARQAGWDSHRRKVLSTLDLILSRNVGVRKSMKEEVDVRLELENGFILRVTLPLTFSYFVEADGSVNITQTHQSFFSPYPKLSPADLASVMEFEYELSKKEPDLEQMQEMERRTAYWLEWAFAHPTPSMAASQLSIEPEGSKRNH